jgi:pentatricopeptide repeat protein
MENPPYVLDCNGYASLLQTCASREALKEGKQVHTHIFITGIELNVFLATALVSMYAKCGSFVDAKLVFDKIPKPNVFSWNALIRGHIVHGHCEDVLELYHQMQIAGIQPDNFTFPFVLKACADLGNLQRGKDIHDCIIRIGFKPDIYVWNGLLLMYVKCGCMEDARQVFDKMSQRDVVSWNTMIAGYAQNGDCDQALRLFRQMQVAGVPYNSVTVASVLPVCASVAAVKQGKEIHGRVVRNAFELDVYVGSALLDMYAKCASLEHAFQVFDKMSRRNVVSWNAMISGCAQNGHAKDALILFCQMQLAGVEPNSSTIASILSACANLAALQQGKEIHHYLIKRGFELDVFVGSSLIDMYAKSKCLESACQLFDEMPAKDVVPLNALMAGYIENKHATEALKLFCELQLEGVVPDLVTIVIALSACAKLAAVQLGKQIHDYIIRNGLDSAIFIMNALIDMYTKSGSIELAGHVFDKMPERDLVSWNAMIVGYGKYGYGKESLAHFYQMQQAKIKPDNVTFTGVLNACSHAGLVDEGWQYFHCMTQNYQITPVMEHYSCMVDLLGRAGHLGEAYYFIQMMPLEPSADVWGALLGACRNYCNIDLGEHVANHLFELEPKNAGNYALLSNMYAKAGRWDDVAKVRTMMKDRGLIKRPGCSWIEVNTKNHVFFGGD